MTILPESKLCIGGELRQAQGGRTYDNINPWTGEVIGKAADATPQDVEDAIVAARKAFDTTDWSRNHAKRYELVKKLYDLFVANKERLGEMARYEAGASLVAVNRASTDVGAQLNTTVLSPAQHVVLLASGHTAVSTGSGVAGASLLANGSASVDASVIEKDTLAILAGKVKAGGNVLVDAISSEVSGVDLTLSALRTWMGENLSSLTVEAAAAALETSTRTLQRRLAALGTSFQREATRARIEAAKRLLLASGAPLIEIALDVGCTSQQHFSALFRREVGEAPGSWRAKHRSSGE